MVIGEYHTESTGVPEFADQHLSILNGRADGITLLMNGSISKQICTPLIHSN